MNKVLERRFMRRVDGVLGMVKGRRGMGDGLVGLGLGMQWVTM